LWSIAIMTGVLSTLAAGEARAQLAAQVVVQGLSAPVDFVPDPTSATRFFVVQQDGLIRVLENGVLRQQPLLDLRGAVVYGGEQGLLGMAFAPDAATSGRFFVNFTAPLGQNGSRTVVARFQRSPANAATVDPATRFDLQWPSGLRYIEQPYGNHNGGHLAFGPDGYLYIGLGDGGAGNDPENRSQSASQLLGKMLRIDVNVGDPDPNGYRVPPDNPFLDRQPIEALGEIWAFGLRNPWRYSFDDFGAGATGALIIGDVGQGEREEVNYEPAGAGGRNYGWRIREGTVATPGISPNEQPAYQPLTQPLFDYVRAIGRAVTGGYVYRGSLLPAHYRGRYFVADFVSSQVASVGLHIDPGTGEASVTDVINHTAELGGSLGGVASFARDLQGELYVVTFAGRVLKIVPSPAVTPGPPPTLTHSVSNRDVIFNWSAPAGGPTPTGFRVEAGWSSGASDIGVFPVGLVLSAGVSGVPDGRYYVRVRAERNGFVGPPSNEVVVTVAANCTAPPPPPQGLTQTVTNQTVNLAWSSTGASGHVIEAGSESGLSNLATIAVGATPSFTTQAPSGTYHVRVRATNLCGASVPSTEVVVVVP
jgi:glucose/arabinose dehydrogenase